MNETGYSERRIALAKVHDIVASYTSQERDTAVLEARMESHGLRDKYVACYEKRDRRLDKLIAAVTILCTIALGLVGLIFKGGLNAIGVGLLLGSAVGIMAGFFVAMIYDSLLLDRRDRIIDQCQTFGLGSYTVAKFDAKRIDQKTLKTAFPNYEVQSRMAVQLNELCVYSEDLRTDISDRVQAIVNLLDRASDYAILSLEEKRELIADMDNLNSQSHITQQLRTVNA